MNLGEKKNLPANSGDPGSIPGLERSHVLWSSKPKSHNYPGPLTSTLYTATREAMPMRSLHTATESALLAAAKESPRALKKKN